MSRYNKYIFTLFLSIVFSARIFAQTDNVSDSTIPPEQVENIFTTKNENEKQDNFQLRSIEKRKIDSLKRLDAFWYADSVFGSRENERGRVIYYNDSMRNARSGESRRQTTREYTDYSSPNGIGIPTFLIIVLLALAAIIFLLFRNNIVGVRRRVATEEEQPEETENIFEINYQRDIENAIAEKNYRLATRLMFLRVLKTLATKNIIQYKQERTNFDYLAQLHASKYYSEFFRLTRNYEYLWYGKFEVSPENFAIIRNEFENFDRKIN